MPKPHKKQKSTGLKVVQNAAGMPELFIYDDIDNFWGIGSAAVKDELQKIGDVADISVRLNSGGGDTLEGFAIYNQLQQHPANIHIAIDGMALSAASTIAMAGDTISMAENAMFMVHLPWTTVSGNRHDLDSMSNTLDMVGNNIAKVYSDASRADMSFDQAMDLMTGEGKADGTWFTAAEALEIGFIDEITENLRIAAHVDTQKMSVPDRFLSRIGENSDDDGAETREKNRNRIISMSDYLTIQE